MRLVFAGSSDFALPALEALLRSEHEVAAVFSPPPRRQGRGLALTAGPVLARAQTLGLPWSVEAPEPERWAALGAVDVAALVVVAYGHKISTRARSAPLYGALNIHPSLLPRWRGAAPVQHALLAGDQHTGVSIMALDSGWDSGPILAQESVPVPEGATTSSLSATLAALGAQMLLQVLAALPAGLEGREQDSQHASMAPRLTREGGRLDWNASAASLVRKVRACQPQPCAWFMLAGEVIKVHEARCCEAALPPGVLDSAAGQMGCGEGAVELIRLQRPGRKVMEGKMCLRGLSGLQARTACDGFSSE